MRRLSGAVSGIILTGRATDLNLRGGGRRRVRVSADIEGTAGYSGNGYQDAVYGRAGAEPSGEKALPRTRIIVLSGYNEFEYAKEAIKIGISDYLLKPVSSAGLIDALKKAADEIREEREKSKLLERYFVSYEKYTEFLDKTDYSGVDRKLINDF